MPWVKITQSLLLLLFPPCTKMLLACGSSRSYGMTTNMSEHDSLVLTFPLPTAEIFGLVCKIKTMQAFVYLKVFPQSPSPVNTSGCSADCLIVIFEEVVHG